MSFEGMKAVAKERPSGSSRNVAVEVKAFAGETVTGIDLESGNEVTTALSADRTYPRRPPLSIYATGGQLEGGEATVRQVHPGGVMLFLQCYESNGVLEAKEVRTLKAAPADKTTVLVDMLARVDRPFKRQSSGKWAQNVIVLADRDSVAVASEADAKARALDALAAGGPGHKGFVLRGISGEAAVAVRFMQPYRQEGQNYVPLSGPEAWDAFLAKELTVSGLRGENGGFVTMAGAQVVAQVGSEGTWELVPCLQASFGSKTVEENQGRNHNPARQFQFDFNDDRSGTGFRPAIVALGEGNEGGFFVNHVATTSAFDPVPMAFVPTGIAQPEVPDLAAGGRPDGQGGTGSPPAGGSGWEPPADLDDEIPFVLGCDGQDLLLGKRTAWGII